MYFNQKAFNGQKPFSGCGFVPYALFRSGWSQTACIFVLFALYYAISSVDFRSMGRDISIRKHLIRIPRGTRMEENSPIVYIITPTCKRMSQAPDLTRMSQTLLAVKSIHWIVVEDSENKTAFVTDLLSKSPFQHTHLYVPTPARDREMKIRGCSQRNKGLEWIKSKNITNGVLYFADDDNAYDIRAFDELRTSKKVGLIPTGNLAITGVSSAVVREGKVQEWFDVWSGGRLFQVEMASFAVNIKFWNERGAPLFKSSKRGYLETDFLYALNVTLSDLEPKADNCTKVLVWHTRTEKIEFEQKPNVTKFKDTNIPTLIEQI